MTRLQDGKPGPVRPTRTIYPIPPVKWLPVLPCILFILLGILFIPYAGVQNDEALFAAPLYGPFAHEFRARIFHHDIPLMLMTYLGTLKTWIFALIFSIWTPNIWSVRIPPILVGAASIYAFWRLLQRTAGTGAAVLGTFLIATDPTYLLTTVFDWGPVAFQHLLLVAGAACVLAAVQEDSPKRLGWGFFLFGLGMWDKALFSWTLGGLVIATLVVFPREVIRRLTFRNLAVATLAFLFGALPFVIYNVRNPLKTFSGNAHFTTSELLPKAQFARGVADGGSLFGYIIAEEWAERPRNPQTAVERASVALRDRLGEHRTGLLFWGFVAALATFPFWVRRSKPVIFGLIFLAVAWFQMAITKDAGGGTHHVVLLWPFPQFVIAVALSLAARRFPQHIRLGWSLAAVLTIAVCGSDLLVVNQYLAQAIRYNSTNVWTDAIAPLARYVHAQGDRDVFIMDWGMFDTIRMLERGTQTMWWGGDGVAPGADQQLLSSFLARRNPVFVTHTAGSEVNEGTRDRLRTMAASLGYQQRIVQTIADANGRPVFEISEFSLAK